MYNYDFLVVGGGIAGVAAAVAAAREGMKVILIEKFGSLGGAMSNSLVYPFMLHTACVEEKEKPLSAGIFAEMKERKKHYDDTSWESYKFVFDDMLTEAGVDVLFHATVYKAECVNRKIKSVFVATKSGVIEIHADYFADTSGDGELLSMVGCDYQLGRENDGLTQPMTTCFRVSGVDTKKFKEEEASLQEKYKQWRKENKISNPRENILSFLGLGDGIVHFNTTRIVKHNPVDPFEISRAEMLARKQINEMMQFLKKNAESFKNSTLISIASHIGVRESRKLKGVYVLTAADLLECHNFEDTIALGNYGIDIHSPDGTGTHVAHMKTGTYYQIPYRCLLPKEYDNMLVAGRCLSATHEAHSAVRIMPICACLGEAAGIAVSLAKNNKESVHNVDVELLKNKIVEKGGAVE